MSCSLLWSRTALYGFCHFWVDWACILLVTGPLRSGAAVKEDWLLLILLYNACAFALQLPLGVVQDRFGHGWTWAGAGALLIAGGWLLTSTPLAACVVAGLGNALFHLGGGREVLLLGGPRAAPSGAFVAPGAVGVFFGVWCARMGFTDALWPVLFLTVLGLLMALLGRRGSETALSWSPVPRWGLAAPLLLAATVTLRGWIGGELAFPWKAGALALAVVLCTALGKGLGGFLADGLGWRRGCALLLAGAALCFLFSYEIPALGMAAALLFQTSMPVTLAALAKGFGAENCGAAFGLTTFCLFLGGLPALVGLPWGITSPLGLSLWTVVSAVLLLAGLSVGAMRASNARPCERTPSGPSPGEGDRP